MFTQVVDVCDWVRLRIDGKASVRISSIVREGGMHINLKIIILEHSKSGKRQKLEQTFIFDVNLLPNFMNRN